MRVVVMRPIFLKLLLSRTDWFPPACLEPTTDHQNTSVFQNISVSPVMKCEGKQKCKLNLRVKAVLELSGELNSAAFCSSWKWTLKGQSSRHYAAHFRGSFTTEEANFKHSLLVDRSRGWSHALLKIAQK